MIVEKSVFERFAPSAIDVETDIYDYLCPFFDRSFGSLSTDLLGMDLGGKIKTLLTSEVVESDDIKEGYFIKGASWSDIRENIFSFIVNKALYLAIPNLDLVLTNNGFGVVNTQMIAPASKERVASLRNACKDAYLTAFDELLVTMPGNSMTSDIKLSRAWQRLTESLVWTKEHYERYCVNAVTDDYDDFKSHITTCMLVMNKIDTIISRKQRIAFIEYLRGIEVENNDNIEEEESDFDPEVMKTATDYLLKCFSELYACILEKKEPFSYAGQELLEYMHENFKYFPNYMLSKQHYVRHAKAFTTTKKDGCFLF